MASCAASNPADFGECGAADLADFVENIGWFFINRDFQTRLPTWTATFVEISRVHRRDPGAQRQVLALDAVTPQGAAIDRNAPQGVTRHRTSALLLGAQVEGVQRCGPSPPTELSLRGS